MQFAKRKALEFLNDPGLARGSKSASLTYARLAEEFGFSSLIICALPEAGENVESLIEFEHWPTGWRDQYLAGNYFARDPVSIAALVSKTAYTWANARPRFTAEARQSRIAQEASSHGLVDGLALPGGERGGRRRLMISLGSDNPIALGQADFELLYLVSIWFQLRDDRPAPPKAGLNSAGRSLSVRERDILCWMAQGKSAWEVAQILTLSEATVTTHLRNIRRKLGANNTTHAVAIGLIQGQITL